MDNNNKTITGPLVYVPTEATAEFTLLQNQFSAEFGHSTGGPFNTVVRSGTNQVHGSIYEYFQNRNLNAVDASVTNNLSVNLGLRWERTTVPLGMGLQALNAASSVPGLIVFKAPSTFNKAFAPRVGIAYSPAADGLQSAQASVWRMTSYSIMLEALPIRPS